MTKVEYEMMETIIRQLPKIRIALEEIALGLNYFRKLYNRDFSDATIPVEENLTPISKYKKEE